MNRSDLQDTLDRALTETLKLERHLSQAPPTDKDTTRKINEARHIMLALITELRRMGAQENEWDELLRPDYKP